MPVVARDGFSSFSLDEVADRADVTRNLLYHYFPDGRSDIIRAVAEQAGHALTDDWVTDESIPLPDVDAQGYAGHGGGDFGLVDSLDRMFRGPDAIEPGLDGFAGHELAFEAELSRIDGGEARRVNRA